MKLQLPVLWSFDGAPLPGCLDVGPDRLTLTSKRRSLSFPLPLLGAYTIERGPADRLRGLPVLVLEFADAQSVRVASMGGAGSLQDLAAVIGKYQRAARGT